MALQFFVLKRGATLALAGTVNLVSGTWTAISEVKDLDGNLVSTLDSTLTAPTPPNTLWLLRLTQTPEDTFTWPLGPLNCDIRFENEAGDVIYTPTFQINVAQEVTDA